MLPIVISSSNSNLSLVPYCVSLIRDIAIFADSKIYVVGSSFELELKDVVYINSGCSELPWTTRIYNGLTKLSDPYFLFITEDIFLTRDASAEITAAHEAFKTLNLCYLSLEYEYGDRILHKGKGLDSINLYKIYKVTVQPGIWRREYMIERLYTPRSIWDFELFCSFSFDSVLCMRWYFKDKYYEEIITKGKVSRSGARIINAKGFSSSDFPTVRSLTTELKVFLNRLFVFSLRFFLKRLSRFTGV